VVFVLCDAYVTHAREVPFLIQGLTLPSSLSPFNLLSFMPFGIVIEIGVDLPSAKQRRMIAGSIVSTALSAALIGTAVGLTVYRL